MSNQQWFNMASTGEWELVVKGSKKGKGATVANGKLNKEEKKQFIQKAPRVTLTGGIEVVAAGKENRKPKSPKAASAPKKKKPEKKNNVGPYQPGTLEEAVCRLSVGEMQNLLDVVVSRFYDSPLIWLKDLASYLNVRVNPVHSPDPAFRGHPNTFPASLLGSEVKKLLVNTLSGCTDNVLALFHKHCITSMVQEQIKGLGVAGYKLFLQILSINHAHVGVMNLPYYCDLRHNIQNQTPACLSMLWAVGQSGLDDFTVGLKDYGSTVFGGGGGDGAEDCGDVLGVREFFTILDFTWCSSVSLPKPVQRQLFALYPKVKTAAFSSSPEVTLRNFFPSFLRRLDPNVSHALRVEILSRSLRVQRKEVRETIEGFAESNEQMSHKARAVAGVIEATEATKLYGSMFGKRGQSQPVDGNSRSRFFSLPLSRSSSLSTKPFCVDQSQEIPCRFSYVRASNSYHRYGRSPNRRTLTYDASSFSSREDLLECPGLPVRRKKIGTVKPASQKYRSGNSSSDDLLNEDSDITDGLFSSGIPETDGSVFSSQEDLLGPTVTPKVKCSANVERFVRRSSSGKGSSISRVSSSPYRHPQNVPVQAELLSECKYNEKNHCSTISSLSTSESEQYEKWNKFIPFKGERRSPSPSQHLHATVTPNGSSEIASHPATPDSFLPMRFKVQSAVVKTICRLVDHLGNVREQVRIIESRCSHLKDTMCALEYTQYVLDAKLMGLERQFKYSDKVSFDSDSGCPQMGVKCGENNHKTACYTFRKPVQENTSSFKTSSRNIDDKTDLSSQERAMEESDFEDFPRFLQVSETDLVLLNQMKTVKGKSPLPRVMKLLGIVLVTAIIWDIRSAGSFYGSKLGQTVERAGLVPYLETFGQASKAAFIHSYKWCVINIPVFYIRGCELAAPYLLLMMEKVEGIIGYCSAALASAEEYIPVLKEKIETSVPGLRASAGHYGTLALETMQVGFLAIKDALTPYLAEAHKFFSTRVFVGPLAPEKLQEYMIGAVDYLSQLLLRMHSSLVSALQDPDTTTNKTS
ncbi:Transmembrane protein 214-like [Homarus americanus]|uniref:Transmembrane protein 214-like n=1 Tax=Homarus americanus TaxID=6706 RepID=A0A8J5JP72_HOMAM|nr:Transmembrane protein 214-like [Homarus americanus]